MIVSETKNCENEFSLFILGTKRFVVPCVFPMLKITRTQRKQSVLLQTTASTWNLTKPMGTKKSAVTETPRGKIVFCDQRFRLWSLVRAILTPRLFSLSLLFSLHLEEGSDRGREKSLGSRMRQTCHKSGSFVTWVRHCADSQTWLLTNDAGIAVAFLECPSCLDRHLLWTRGRLRRQGTCVASWVAPAAQASCGQRPPDFRGQCDILKTEFDLSRGTVLEVAGKTHWLVNGELIYQCVHCHSDTDNKVLSNTRIMLHEVLPLAQWLAIVKVHSDYSFKI